MKSNKAHRLLALLLAFVMTFSLLPTVAWAAETPTSSGMANADGLVTWKYYESTGTLKFSGSGAVKFDADDAPWDQLDVATHLVIESGITEIAESAFGWAPCLESVSLPNTLTKIGEWAFQMAGIGDEVVMQSITIPSSVVEIGEGAFSEWTSDQKIILEYKEGCKPIACGSNWRGNAVVEANGRQITGISIPAEGTYGDNITWKVDEAAGVLTFSGTGAMHKQPVGTTYDKSIYPWWSWLGTDSAVKKVVFAEGITSISTLVLSNAAVSEVELPASLREIGEQAFASCTAKTFLIKDGLTTIGNSAFRSCTSVEKIVLPASVTNIGATAFTGWKNTQTIQLRTTEAQAKRDITFGSSWSGSAKVVYDLGLDTTWAKDAKITLTAGGESFDGTLDLTQYRVTFDRPMYTPANFTFDDAAFAVTVGKVQNASKTLTVEKLSNGLYLAKETLTIAPDGDGDAIPLDVSFNVPKKVYNYAGSGTETDPYIIDCLDALAAVARDINNDKKDTTGVYYKQTADIDMTGVSDWTPIAQAASNGSCDRPFNGTYDGGGYRIKNFVYNNAETSYFGLFGVLGKNAVVKGIVLDESCSITAKSYVGGIAARSSGRIEDCVNYGTVRAQGLAGSVPYLVVGGIVGDGKYLINCANYGEVTGNPNSSGFSADGGAVVGGIAGYANVLSNCRNYGTVTGGMLVGGVAGSVRTSGSTAENPLGIVSGCANYGIVNAREKAGGLVGELTGLMEDCYNLGTVKVEKTTVGGLVGTANTSPSGNERSDMIGVFNSYHAGSVQYGAEEAEPVAGHLIGNLNAAGVVVGDNEKCIGDLYYKQEGIMPAIGNYDAGDRAAAMPLTAMQAQEFVDELNSYTNISLYGVMWKQGGSESQNLPVCDSFETLKNYACDLTGLTVNGSAALLDKNGDYYFVLPYGTDLTNVTVAATVSPRATVTPADGVVNFSNGPVTFTVTAEDGTTKTYPVNVTAAASPKGLTALRLGSHVMGEVDPADTNGTILLDPNDFAQDTTTYNFTQYDTVVIPSGASGDGWNYYYIWAVPAETDATMTAAIGERTKTIAAATDMTAKTYESISYDDLMKLGENTLTLTVTPPENGSGTETAYHFHLTVLPTLKTVTFAEEGLEQDQAFAPETLDYTLKVPNSVKSLTPNVAATLSDGVTVTYSPALDADGKLPLNKLDNGKFTITVSGTEAGATSTTYTYTVETIGTYDAKITTNADGAQVRIYQGDTLVTPGKDGVYSLRTDKTYKYVVVAKGYVTKSGTITQPALTDSILTVTLSAVPAISLPDYKAFWPNFRGNDQNMAITNIKTPTGQIDAETKTPDVELLWASASGSGYDSGAVGSPIFVGGYMYAYAGSKLLKLDPANGETVASANMVSNSDFAIIPPTYADGMIFVALKEGRVQAFRADTLESLWVYQDPLKGQSNSPITYSDGYVYVGFWNGESKPANFVCLTADYEGTSTKEALWRYTSQGGFYWAGAYANDKYVVVGTDDGQSGYTSQTAKLVVFDKRTGEIVDSKEGYTGDIRSNIAYADGRVYFTSKGGYFYSEVLGDNGKLSGSQSIALGGMSTSTPVVYNNRAYVGVSGDGQFTAYSGHHIAVLDLNSWSVAYTAATQGYPQTSGLLSTNTEDGSVNVYFMDNYTPGVMRVINDSAGQTALKNGITENGKSNCAPVVFKPEGPLAQYCICSPVVDEYGTLYFKNDSGNLIALTSAVKELVVAEAPESIDVDVNKVQVTGGKIVAKLANGMERDVTKLVTYRLNDEKEPEAVYTYGAEVGSYTLSTKTVSLIQKQADIKIGNGSVDGTTVDGVTTFKAGTSADAPEIKVTAPAAGWKLDAENTFTVSSDNDVACVVLVKKADGSYEKLAATTGEDGTHSFTATLAADDSIVVALKGDVDGDGKLTSSDVVVCKAVTLEKTTLEGHYFYAALVTNGSSITSSEVALIKAVTLERTTIDW